ncbi:helix-turn-helix domain-containing protein [Massilia niabensis]|uniref:Helix-turn-helix domain-containing protein n=1 Tax=Massilia niabensis TaxID=544910 RepID=A0ABW0LA18_9BURK
MNTDRAIQLLMSPLPDAGGTPWGGLPVKSFSVSSGFQSRLACPSMHLLLYLKGSPKVSWSNGKQTFRRNWKYGDYSFVGKDLEIRNVSVDGDHEGLAIQIPFEEMDRRMQNFSSLPLHLYGEDPQLFNMALSIKDEIGRGCPCGKIFAESISLALLTYFYGNHCTEQPHGRGRSGGFPPARLRLIEEYIGANLGNNISLLELAALARLSPSRFSRIFSKATGMPPHRYVMHARVERAKTILKSSDRSVTDVALELGFASPSHFSFAFRKSTGTSPREFAQHR